MGYTDRLKISDAELKSFVQAVKTRFGLDFTNYEKKSLKRGLVRLISRNKLKTMMGLWGLMLRDKKMIVRYIDELLVNLTEFFRNYEVWQTLNKEVLPTFIIKKRIDFWHAGCSTGEEVYTMAILLRERFMLHKSKVVATDLSSKALEQAVAGQYNPIVWEKYKKNYLLFNTEGKPEKYFHKREKYYETIPQLKNHVTFLRHNLVQDAPPQQFDIIFCRNVMIYFDEVLKMQVLKMFHSALKEGGYLIIGYYDMLPYESKEMFSLYCGTSRIYTKNTAKKDKEEAQKTKRDSKKYKRQ